MAMGKKDHFKTRVENTIRNVNIPVQDQSLTVEKSWVMMMQQTNRKHEKQEEGRSTNEMDHAEKSDVSP